MKVGFFKTFLANENILDEAEHIGQHCHGETMNIILLILCVHRIH